MTDKPEDIVKWLRNHAFGRTHGGEAAHLRKAATRIEELEKELERLRSDDAAPGSPSEKPSAELLTADEVMTEIEAVASEPVARALRLCFDGMGRDPAREKGKIADVALRDLALEPITLYRRRVPREEAPIFARTALEPKP